MRYEIKCLSGLLRKTTNREFGGELGIDSLRRGRVSRPFAERPIYRFAQPFWEIFRPAAGGETPPLRPYKFGVHRPDCGQATTPTQGAERGPILIGAQGVSDISSWNTQTNEHFCFIGINKAPGSAGGFNYEKTQRRQTTGSPSGDSSERNAFVPSVSSKAIT